MKGRLRLLRHRLYRYTVVMPQAYWAAARIWWWKRTGKWDRALSADAVSYIEGAEALGGRRGEGPLVGTPAREPGDRSAIH